jgi:hypothetical protein
MNTTNITLLSGVPATIRLMTGEMQEALFGFVGKKNFQEELAKMILASVGNNENVESCIDKMPAADFQDLLVQWRLASYDNYIKVKLKDEQKNSHEVEVSFSYDLFTKQAPAKLIGSYDDLEPTYMVELSNGKKLRVERLTLKHLKNDSTEKPTALTPLVLRRIVEIGTDEKLQKERPIFYDLRKALAKDIEFIRKSIYKEEGKFVDTITVKHGEFPEQVINPMAEVSFFLQEF